MNPKVSSQKLDQKDTDELRKRYKSNFKKFGVDVSALEWGKGGRQRYRFSILCEDIIQNPSCSVLDVGCGFADMYHFLMEMGWKGRYTGLDICDEFITAAKERIRGDNASLICDEFTNCDFNDESFDYVICCGMHYIKFVNTDNEAFIKGNMSAMLKLAGRAVIVDFMTSYVDFIQPNACHLAPEDAFRYAKELTRRVKLRHDYMPYEYCVILHKNDAVTENNVFQGAILDIQ